MAAIHEEQEHIIAEPDEADVQGGAAFYEQGINFLIANGWYFLLGGVVGWYVYKTYIENRLQSWSQNREERRTAAQYHKDPDKFYEQQVAMETARRRLQEQHDQKVQQHIENSKEKEEKKRQEKLQDWDRHQEGRGYRSKVKTNEDPKVSKPAPKPKKKLRDDGFNPLMGNPGGSSYRSASRNFRGGG